MGPPLGGLDADERTVLAVRVVDVRECSVPISRFTDPSLPGGGLTTSAVAVVTDMRRDGEPVVGYGFGSFGRYAQGGLIRERSLHRKGSDPLYAQRR